APETSYWEQIEGRRRMLARMGRWTLYSLAITHAPELISFGIDTVEVCQLEVARNSRWVTSPSLYPVTEGIVEPSTKVTLGDSLGKGFVANGQPSVSPDQLVTNSVNEYLSQGTWRHDDFSQVGATTDDVLMQLQDGSDVVRTLQTRRNIDITLSLLGNDLGDQILRKYGSFEAFEAKMQSPWNGPEMFMFMSDALSQYKQNVTKILTRLEELRQGGVDIKRVIIPGPPNFGYANGVSVRIPRVDRRGYETKIINLQNNQTAKKFGAVFAIELFAAQTDILDTVGEKIGFEALIIDNFRIRHFSLDQHLLPRGYQQMAVNQTNRYMGRFGRANTTFTQEIHDRAS
ncbi:MAG TPA: hypothetical protein VF820_07200, partial [Patescibacteria group bacterium]